MGRLSFINNISHWKKSKKFSIWLLIIGGIFLIVILIPQLVKAKLVPFDSLPTWQVNNPVSKVFVMDEIPPTSGSLAAGDSTVSNVYLVDPAIDTLLLMMKTQGIYLHKTSANPSGIVGSDDIVIIKGSFQWDFRNTTSTDRIKGLIWQILQHPEGFTGEILVGDNTQWAPIDQNDNNSEDTDQSILDVINTFHSKGYPVYLFEWKNIMYNVVTEYSDGDYNDGYTYDSASKITYPKFRSPSGNHYISLKYGIWNAINQNYNHDRLCIIDFPVLKAHGWTGATLAIKNWIGLLTVAYQNERYGGNDAMHFDYLFSSYALVAKVMQVTYPKLTIIDAAWTNPERNYGNVAIQLNMLLGSTDPFAASWYAAKYMLTPVAYYPERTDPDNIGGVYNLYFSNWINCMLDSGFAVTKDSSEISVFDRATLSTTSTFNLTVSIYNGWNMVSIPGLHATDQNVNTWWAFRDMSANVFKYLGGYLSVTTATPGIGYWLKHSEARTYNTGDEWPPGGIQIVPHDPLTGTVGWNLIGGYELSVTAANVTTVPPGLQSGPTYKYSGGYQVATTIDPGYGYWIRLTGAGQIIIPETLVKDSKAVEYFPEDWGKIMLTDATGTSYTLYSVKGEVDLNQYELPPLPQEGMFDIRYASGRIAEDIKGKIHTVLMKGIKHPLTIQVENMDILISDETGQKINKILKFDQNLTIDDMSIIRLLITEVPIPEKFVLYQNYPNPFNTSTKIKFVLPKETNVELCIYNVLGDLISKVFDEMKTAGNYEYVFDASNVSSGVYLYKLNAEGFVDTKKMILIK